MPGSLPLAIRIMLHYYAPVGSRRASTSTCATPSRCAPTSPQRSKGQCRSDINETIAAIPVYPQASTYAFGGPLVKMSSNESPFAPHPAVAEAITAAGRDVNRYPDPSGSAFREKLAETYDMAVEQIVLGNGSCEILLAGAQVLLRAGRRARLRLAVVLDVPAPGRDDRRDRRRGAADAATTATTFDAMLAAITAEHEDGPDLQPEQPDRHVRRPRRDQLTSSAKCPSDVCVVIDEAYIEFVEGVDRDGLLPLVIEHDNVVITRTFAKIYGLAGLRVGYGFAPVAFKQRDRPRASALQRQPRRAGRGDRGAQSPRRCDRARDERRWPSASGSRPSCAKLGLATAETQTNFSWIDLGGLDRGRRRRRSRQRGDHRARRQGARRRRLHPRQLLRPRRATQRFIAAMRRLAADGQIAYSVLTPQSGFARLRGVSTPKTLAVKNFGATVSLRLHRDSTQNLNTQHQHQPQGNR